MPEIDRTRLIEARARAMWPGLLGVLNYRPAEPTDEEWTAILAAYKNDPLDANLILPWALRMAEATLAADVALGLAVVPVEPSWAMAKAYLDAESESGWSADFLLWRAIKAGDIARKR